MLLLSLAITLCVVAWGYLVYAAIDFGSEARGGESQAWAFLGLACLGAAACLFTGMILVGRLLRAAGILSDPAPIADEPAITSYVDLPPRISPGGLTDEDTAQLPTIPTPRHQGGKRAAR